MQPTNYITAQCQATTVKYNNRDYSIQTDKKGFRYIKISHQGKRIIMPIKNEEPDIVVDYVFFGKFKTQPNPIIDMCFIMRTKGKTEKVYNKNKNNLNLPYTFQEFKQIAAQLNKNYKEQKKLHQHTKS